MHVRFLSENLKGRDHSEDLGVDGRIILEWILVKTVLEFVEWIRLDQDRDWWQDPANTVMNLWVP
jgi:hypothetical protein